MKILLVGPKWIGGWLEGVEGGAQHFGHTVQKFYYDSPAALETSLNRIKTSSHVPSALQKFLGPVTEHLGETRKRRMNDELVFIGRAFQPDLILILKGETLETETLATLRLPGRRIVSWWVDNPILYFANHPQLRSHFDYIDALFIFDRGHLEELKSLGVNELIYLPCAADPNVYYPRVVQPADLKRYKCDIGFIANYYPGRGTLLKHMQGLDVAIWGMDWIKTPELKCFPSATWRGNSLPGNKVAIVYNVATICPNVHHSQSVVGGFNMRTFEVPSAGGFELLDDVPGLEEHFEIGKEIIVYKSPEHFRELADYFLSHPVERISIIERGRARVMRDHTYQQRLGVIFRTLEHMQ